MFLAMPPKQSVGEVLGLLARVSSLVLLAVLALWAIEWRWKIVSRFFDERRTALDLSVFRIALMMAYVISVDPTQVLRLAKLDPALIVPPVGWGPMANWFPRNVVLAELVAVAFFVSIGLALIGLWTRISVVVAVLAGFYLFTIPQLFGKINHSHDLVLFGLLLACSPSGDALSIDALLAKRRGRGVPALVESRRYAAPLQAVMLLMGVTYFFPGAWKISRLGLEWFRSTHLQALVASKLSESLPTHFQLWMLHQSALFSIGAFFTIVFELGWILLVIARRTRPIAFAMGLGFHNMTNLMMNIPFWGLQFCYVALVDWGRVLDFLSPQFRTARAAAQQWANAIEDDWGSQSLGRAFLGLAGVMVVAMVLAGIGHVVNGWPLACYPTFDGPAETFQRKLLAFEGYTKEGSVLNETLSNDRVLLTNYHTEIWRGMTEAEGCPGRLDSEARARALLGLWQGEHLQTDLASATLYCDTYDRDLDPLHRTEHLQIRTVKIQEMAAH